jgi:hypothetical protein
MNDDDRLWGIVLELARAQVLMPSHWQIKSFGLRWNISIYKGFQLQYVVDP